MTLFNSRKGIAPIIIVGIFAFVMVVIYLLLYIPIPAFTSLRSIINYFLSIMFFILIQVAIILGYYYAVRYAIRGINLYKGRIQKTALNIKSFVITKGR
jgi:hypothetical protein